MGLPYIEPEQSIKNMISVLIYILSEVLFVKWRFWVIYFR